MWVGVVLKGRDLSTAPERGVGSISQDPVQGFQRDETPKRSTGVGAGVSSLESLLLSAGHLDAGSVTLPPLAFLPALGSSF